jgi:glycosyltransferase involved in cell wall biosynthesis
MDLPNLNLIQGVHHLGWQEDPAPYLAISNTMVFPSEREGMPVCMMEAQSMGLPVVTVDSRGCREIVNDSNGFVTSRNEQSLLIALRLIASDFGLQRKMSKNVLLLRNVWSRNSFYQTVETSYTI